MEQTKKPCVNKSTPTPWGIRICKLEVFVPTLLFFFLTHPLLHNNYSWTQQNVSPPAENRTSLTLPFKGFWRVTQGNNGSTSHNGASRYAWDFVFVDIEGRSRSKNASSIKDYYTFSAEVMAPAAGTIVKVVNSSPDSTPGVVAKDLPSNQITIDHGNGEQTKMFHLKKGSIIVKEGDYVSKGQVIGYAGNSGHSTGPHLDIRLGTLRDGVYQTIPTRFASLILFKDGSFYKHPTNIPLQDEIVCNSIYFFPKASVSKTVKNQVRFAQIVHQIAFLSIDLQTFYMPYYKNQIIESQIQQDLSALHYQQGALYFFMEGKWNDCRHYLHRLEDIVYSKDESQGSTGTGRFLSLPFHEEKYKDLTLHVEGKTKGAYRYIQEYSISSPDPWVYVYAPADGVVSEVVKGPLPIQGLDTYAQPSYVLVHHSNDAWYYLGSLDPTSIQVTKGQAVYKGTVIGKSSFHPIIHTPKVDMGWIEVLNGIKTSIPFELAGHPPSKP